MTPAPGQSEYDSLRHWLDVAQTGTASEREEAIEKLRQAAAEHATGQPEPINYYGLALHWTGRNEEAIPVFDWLVKHWPGIDMYRLTLATV